MGTFALVFLKPQLQDRSPPSLCCACPQKLNWQLATSRESPLYSLQMSKNGRNAVRSFGINQHLMRTHSEKPHYFILLHCSQHSQDSHKKMPEQACLCSALWGRIFWKKPSGCIVSNRRLQKLEAFLLKAVAIGKSFRKHSKSASIADRNFDTLPSCTTVEKNSKILAALCYSKFLLDWSMSFFSGFLPQGFEYRRCCDVMRAAGSWLPSSLPHFLPFPPTVCKCSHITAKILRSKLSRHLISYVTTHLKKFVLTNKGTSCSWSTPIPIILGGELDRSLIN